MEELQGISLNIGDEKYFLAKLCETFPDFFVDRLNSFGFDFKAVVLLLLKHSREGLPPGLKGKCWGKWALTLFGLEGRSMEGRSRATHDRRRAMPA